MKNLFLLFIGVSFFMISACAKKVDITAENKALVARALEEIFNRGNLDVADEIYATDYVLHPHHQWGASDRYGTKTIKYGATDLRAAFPDVRFTMEDMIAEGDMVASRWTFRGTNQDKWKGIPPTGSQVTITGILWSRIEDGKIVEEWSMSDQLGLRQQLGFIPPMSGGPPSMDRDGEDFLWGKASSVTGAPGDPEANKSLYMREAALFEQGNLDEVDEIIHPNFVNHDPVYPDVTDFDSSKEWVAFNINSLPAKLTIDALIAEGDKVACLWTARFPDFINPASGKQITAHGVDITRFADGKVVERWWSKDGLGVMQQVGIIPPPEQGR